MTTKPIVSIAISADLLARVDRLSDRMRRSRSSIVCLLLIDALARQAGNGTTDQRTLDADNDGARV